MDDKLIFENWIKIAGLKPLNESNDSSKNEEDLFRQLIRKEIQEGKYSWVNNKKTKPVSLRRSKANQPYKPQKYDASSQACDKCGKVGVKTRPDLATGEEICVKCDSAATELSSPVPAKKSREASNLKKSGIEQKKNKKQRLLAHIKKAVSSDVYMKSLARKWSSEGQIDSLTFSEREFVKNNMAPYKFSELVAMARDLKKKSSYNPTRSFSI